MTKGASLLSAGHSRSSARTRSRGHVLIVGNGAIGVDSDGNCFINRHTAAFLGDLHRLGHQVVYLAPRSELAPDENLTDAKIASPVVLPIPFSKTDARTITLTLHHLLRADFVYLFFPGTLSRLLAKVCRAIGKPYGIYLRGERFTREGSDATTFRSAQFVCTVGGLGDRIADLNPLIQPIQPMLDISTRDIRVRDFKTRPPGPWRLLFVGRLETEKGIRELISAARMLERAGLSFTLRIVGTGPLHRELEAELRRDPCPRIILVGLLKDKPALMTEYDSADVFVLPTHHEGFPRVLYEAMIKSLPILTTFVGGIPGLMKDGLNSVEIPVGDAQALADTVMQVVADPRLLQTLSSGALATVNEVLDRHPTHARAVEALMLR